MMMIKTNLRVYDDSVTHVLLCFIVFRVVSVEPFFLPFLPFFFKGTRACVSSGENSSNERIVARIKTHQRRRRRLTNNDDDELVGPGKQRRRSILPERVAGRSPIGAEMRRPFRRARDAAETHRGRAGTFLRHDLRR